MTERIKELYTEHREVINYLVVGVLTTIVALAAYYICVFTFLDPQKPLQLQAANVISWIAGVNFAYVMNRKYVFESSDPHILKEMAAFYAARLVTLGMDMGTMFLMVTVAGINDKFAKLVAQFLVIVFNYVFSKLLVFRGKNSESPET